jgi:hypothetical protein
VYESIPKKAAMSSDRGTLEGVLVTPTLSISEYHSSISVHGNLIGPDEAQRSRC